MNDKPRKTAQDFTALVDAVRRVHDECAAAVNRTVNTTLTLRNWLIGSYIRDYEQNGADRAYLITGYFPESVHFWRDFSRGFVYRLWGRIETNDGKRRRHSQRFKHRSHPGTVDAALFPG